MAKGTPIDVSDRTRQRATNPDLRLDTFLIMGSATNADPPAQFEIAVPNGTYSVTVAVGDDSFIDSHHVIRVNGREILNFTPSSGDLHRTVTAGVVVTDGSLLVDPTGGTNTKLDYLEVIPFGASLGVVTRLRGSASIAQSGASAFLRLRTQLQGAGVGVARGTASFKTRTNLVGTSSIIVVPGHAGLMAKTKLVATATVVKTATAAFQAVTRLQGQLPNAVSPGSGTFLFRSQLTAEPTVNIRSGGSAQFLLGSQLTGSGLGIAPAASDLRVAAVLTSTLPEQIVPAAADLVFGSRLRGTGQGTQLAEANFGVVSVLAGTGTYVYQRQGLFVVAPKLAGSGTVVQPSSVNFSLRSRVRGTGTYVVAARAVFAVRGQLQGTPTYVAVGQADLSAISRLRGEPTAVLLATAELGVKTQLEGVPRRIRQGDAGTVKVGYHRRAHFRVWVERA